MRHVWCSWWCRLRRPLGSFFGTVKMNFLPKLIRRQKGVAAVEFGLLMTFILVPLTFGMTEYGRAIYQYNTLMKSTRNAARFLSQQAPGDPTDIATAICLTTYGTPDCSGSLLAPGLTAAMVSICDPSRCPSTHAGIPTSGGSGSVNLALLCHVTQADAGLSRRRN